MIAESVMSVSANLHIYIYLCEKNREYSLAYISANGFDLH